MNLKIKKKIVWFFSASLIWANGAPTQACSSKGDEKTEAAVVLLPVAISSRACALIFDDNSLVYRCEAPGSLFINITESLMSSLNLQESGYRYSHLSRMEDRELIILMNEGNYFILFSRVYNTNLASKILDTYPKMLEESKSGNIRKALDSMLLNKDKFTFDGEFQGRKRTFTLDLSSLEEPRIYGGSLTESSKVRRCVRFNKELLRGLPDAYSYYWKRQRIIQKCKLTCPTDIFHVRQCEDDFNEQYRLKYSN